MSKKIIDKNTFSRHKLFRLFSAYDDPFFNMSAFVDVTALLNYCKSTGTSFFHTFLYYQLKTVNGIPELKQRIEDDKIVEYDVIHGGSTILLPDNTFTFAYFDYFENIGLFLKSINDTLNKVDRSVDPKDEVDNLIHFSVIPWISFTSFKHARKLGSKDCIPKIVFGKYTSKANRIEIPVSIEVNHALVDGYHIGQYFEHLQHNLNKLSELTLPI